MAKTGPTPSPGAPPSVQRRRVAGPELRKVAIDLPAPVVEWLSETRAEYEEYCRSKSARLLQPSDVHKLLRLFDNTDRLNRVAVTITDGEHDVHKALQAYRIIDGIVARQSMELGHGPLARNRLGITEDAGELDELDEFLGGDNAGDS